MEGVSIIQFDCITSNLQETNNLPLKELLIPLKNLQ